MSKQQQKDLVLWVITAVSCLMAFVAFSIYLSKGNFPLLVPTFSPPVPAAPDQREKPERVLTTSLASEKVASGVGDSTTYCAFAYPGCRDIYVIGPKDAGGKIIPVTYFSRRNNIRVVRNERGEVTWEALTAADVPLSQLQEPIDTKSLEQTLKELHRRMQEGGGQ
jgi:hypothetical protein